MDGDSEVDVPTIRKAMKRIATKLKRHHDHFSKTLLEDSPATTDFYTLEEAFRSVESLQKDYLKKAGSIEGEETDDDLISEDETAYDTFQELLIATKFTIKLLLSKRAVHRTTSSLEIAVDSLNAAFNAAPDGDHTLGLTTVKDKTVQLAAELETTNIKDTDALKLKAAEVLKRSYLVQGKAVKKVSPDTWPIISTEKARGGYKVATLQVPKFSGLMRDWHPFWSAFKETFHDSSDFSNTTKLGYLRDAQLDEHIYRQLCKPSDDGRYYEKAVAELQDQFDKPRTMHGVYLEDVLKIGPVKPTRASLLTCASTLSDSLDGLNRFKQTDVYSILTSIAVGFLPEKLRMAWERTTEKSLQWWSS